MTLATQDLEYTDDGTTLDGVVVLDEGRSDQRPGVLLIHGGAGLDGHARSQAHRYAELGYVVLARDMYGRGIAGDRERVTATLVGLRDAPVGWPSARPPGWPRSARVPRSMGAWPRWGSVSAAWRR